VETEDRAGQGPIWAVAPLDGWLYLHIKAIFIVKHRFDKFFLKYFLKLYKNATFFVHCHPPGHEVTLTPKYLQSY
jgi:hypothetical protein